MLSYGGIPLWIETAGGKASITGITFFGHGWPQGIQFGFNRKTAFSLADCVSKNSTDDAIVVLYACLAAENDKRERTVGNVGPATDGGFADTLRDELVRYNLNSGWVDAHKTKGHTTINPFLVRFLCSEVDDPEEGGVGGAWLVESQSQMWRAWRDALVDADTHLRYDFPFMTEMDIKKRLLER